VVSRQWIGLPSFVENIANIQDHVGQAFDSALHLHPFAVSPEGGSQFTLPTYVIINHNHETATRHEKPARQFGKAWVDDRVCRHHAQDRDIGASQALLLCSYGVGQ